jgi:hypothetical protein
MKRIWITLPVIFFVFISFTGLPFNDKLADIFFGICSVLFSVGMSQAINFDFSKIVDKEIYSKNVNGIKEVRLSFIFQFVFASISFIILQVLRSSSIALPPLCLKGKQFSIEIFLNLIIIYSLFFFLYNFHILANKKAALDQTYRDEAMEGLE